MRGASQLVLVALLVPLWGCQGQIGDPGVGPGDPPVDPPTDCELCVGDSYLLRLTRSEYERSLRTVLGDAAVDPLRMDFLPSDGSAGPFASNAFFNVDDDGVEAYRAVAEAAGTEAAANADALLACDPTDASCVDGFVRRIGAQLYRRPISDDEATAFVGLFEEHAALGTSADGVRLVVTAMLQSVNFLYRIEVGLPTERDGVRALTGYELATRLAFFLWQSGPDAELMEAAETGALETREGVEAQARRMLADDRSNTMILRFHMEWLGMDELDQKRVDDVLFPTFESLKMDMIEESEAFVLHVFENDDARLETLLNAPYTFVTPGLAAHYGMADVPEGELTMVTLDPTERAGILTQAGFIAAHTTDSSSAGVHRGLAIRERFFCQSLPPPPPIDTIIAPNPMLSSRQKLEAKTSPDECQACHQLMNPVGFTLEHYDAIGAFRTMDGAHPVDASGYIIDTDIVDPIDGALELITALTASDDVKQCLTRQWLRFALARPTEAADESSAEEAYAAYEASGGDLRELIIAVTTTSAFRYRGIPSE